MAKSKYQPPKVVQEEHQEFFKKIGSRLKEIREARDVTITQLSTNLKISRNNIPRLESGEIYFNSLTLIRVLDYFNIDPIKFFKDL